MYFNFIQFHFTNINTVLNIKINCFRKFSLSIKIIHKIILKYSSNIETKFKKFETLLQYGKVTKKFQLLCWDEKSYLTVDLINISSRLIWVGTMVESIRAPLATPGDRDLFIEVCSFEHPDLLRSYYQTSQVPADTNVE